MASSWLELACSFAVIFCLKATQAEWNTNDYLKREHTLVKPYQGSGMSLPLWDFTGSTMVTNSYVRLTSDHQSLQGAIWNSVPCRSNSWELHVQFKVHGSGKNLFGDGFAIWYVKDRMQTGSVFGSKDYFVGLVVFLDTYSNHNGPHNHQHPYISAMINNGSLHYDHDRDGTHTQVAGCEAQFRNKDHDTYVAIRYHNHELKVSIDIENKNGWKECFSVKGIKIPTGYYFGASATTGQLADNHDIISMKMYELDDDVEEYTGLPTSDTMEAPREHIEDEPKGAFMLRNMSGWKLLIIIILSFIGLGILKVETHPPKLIVVAILVTWRIYASCLQE
ncbi:hypothetical protein ScPMuIL_000453 [Solemya velum]